MKPVKNWAKIRSINKARKFKKEQMILKESNANEVLKELLTEASIYLNQAGIKDKDEYKQIVEDGINNFLEKLESGQVKIVFSKEKSKGLGM